MTDNPTFEICKRVAEAQAVLEDCVAGGGDSAAVVKRLHVLFSEPELLRAMHAVGYFPRSATPPATL